ncbi:MAG: DUF378 domain-containing protein [Candidatus Doudnabacteria bacterium]
MKALHIVTFLLLFVGGINWGLVGLFDFNLVNLIFGSMTWLENLVYILVGVSAIYFAFTHKKECSTCSSSSARQMPQGM